MRRLLVINPNSNEEVTANIARILKPWHATGLSISCITNSSGPDTIASDEDVQAVAEDVSCIVAASSADAILIACFSDPGVDAIRRVDARPILGIQEAGILAALARAEKFGVIGLSNRAVARHLKRIERIGFMSRCAGEIGLSGFGALEVGRSDQAYEEALAAVAILKSKGAGAVVLGCAGFGPRRKQLADESGVIVIDPVVAGAALAASFLVGE
ncbi:aspartate/glutamate racemase family protein [Brucella pseudogrignonensis]|uniref:aspartate/glutamate racemase family protein n=1 Tax=Brucella pseudogrignonensis TaxID=419475 RepID=UPI003D9851D3